MADFTQPFIVYEKPSDSQDQNNETDLDIKQSVIIGDSVPLIEDGEKIMVDDSNKFEFIRLCIEYYSYKSIAPYLDALISEF